MQGALLRGAPHEHVGTMRVVFLGEGENPHVVVLLSIDREWHAKTGDVKDDRQSSN